MEDLHRIRNHLFDKAEYYWKLSLITLVSIQLLTLSSSFFENLIFTSIVGSLSLISAVLIIFFRDRSGLFSGQADKCRRLILYADAFGKEIPQDEIKVLKSWVLGENVEKAPFLEPYYASELESGGKRLLDDIAESSFYTSFLAKKVAYRILILLGFSIILSIAILSLSLTFTSTKDQLVFVIKAVLSFGMFIFTGDVFMMWISYSRLSRAAHSTFEKCCFLLGKRGVGRTTACHIAEDYHVELATSNPIPFFIYDKYNEHLHNLFMDNYRVASGTEQSAGADKRTAC